MFTNKETWDKWCEVYDRAWAWMLEDIRLVPTIPIKGQLSIFNVDITYKDLNL